jgi:hypothetical protein
MGGIRWPLALPDEVGTLSHLTLRRILSAGALKSVIGIVKFPDDVGKNRCRPSEHQHAGHRLEIPEAYPPPKPPAASALPN